MKLNCSTEDIDFYSDSICEILCDISDKTTGKSVGRTQKKNVPWWTVGAVSLLKKEKDIYGR